MSKWPMRGHFRYLRFKTFRMTLRTPQGKVFCPLLSSSEHSGVPEDFKSSTFPSVGLHPHTWPKWGCDTCKVAGVPTLVVLGLPFRSPGTKSHLDVTLVKRCRVYYIGEGGGFPRVRAMVSLVSPKSPMACPNTKGVPT
jgi:hypothetical protein